MKMSINDEIRIEQKFGVVVNKENMNTINKKISISLSIGYIN